jgi:hypothetical protein
MYEFPELMLRRGIFSSNDKSRVLRRHDNDILPRLCVQRAYHTTGKSTMSQL